MWRFVPLTTCGRDWNSWCELKIVVLINRIHSFPQISVDNFVEIRKTVLQSCYKWRLTPLCTNERRDNNPSDFNHIASLSCASIDRIRSQESLTKNNSFDRYYLCFLTHSRWALLMEWSCRRHRRLILSTNCGTTQFLIVLVGWNSGRTFCKPSVAIGFC